MCGYIEINGERPDPIMTQPSFEEFWDHLPIDEFKMYYPAFGQNPNRKIDLIIEEEGQIKRVEATWWFDCFDTSEGLMVGNRTTFNARNLTSPFWKNALQNHRGIVFASGIGESKLVGKTKHQYYMQSPNLFALGALYRKFSNNQYSCAIITRDAHPKMEPYHDKAFPGFLPMDAGFLKLWLNKTVTRHPQIDQALACPILYPTLEVQRVKTYKDKVPMKSSPAVTLQSDLDN